MLVAGEGARRDMAAGDDCAGGAIGRIAGGEKQDLRRESGAAHLSCPGPGAVSAADKCNPTLPQGRAFSHPVRADCTGLHRPTVAGARSGHEVSTA